MIRCSLLKFHPVLILLALFVEGSLLSSCNLGYDTEGTELMSLADSTPDTSGPHETECDNWADDDSDGLADCGDIDCQSSLSCVGGGRIIGDPCTASNNCRADNRAPACLTAWPDGYCTQFCDPNIAQCPGNTACQSVQHGEVTAFVCMVRCGEDRVCRDGYNCVLRDGDVLVCVL